MTDQSIITVTLSANVPLNVPRGTEKTVSDSTDPELLASLGAFLRQVEASTLDQEHRNTKLEDMLDSMAAEGGILRIRQYDSRSIPGVVASFTITP